MLHTSLARRLRRAICIAALAGVAASSHGLAQTKSSAPVRGVVRALRQASIGIDLPVRVAKLHYREGEAFKKGDKLVTFDCKRVQAEHAAAVAASREMRLSLQSQTYLDARGAAGKLDVEISRARADKAEAEASAIAARLEQCVITAPFDGRITELKINEHEVPPNGQPFISLVEETQFEIDLILPSSALRSVEPGTPLQFRIDETGVVYEARLLRFGASIDPVSQSIKAIAAFGKNDGRIVAGMSGSAEIPGMDAIR